MRRTRTGTRGLLAVAVLVAVMLGVGPGLGASLVRAATVVKSVRFGTHPGMVRIVVDVSGEGAVPFTTDLDPDATTLGLALPETLGEPQKRSLTTSPPLTAFTLEARSDGGSLLRFVAGKPVRVVSARLEPPSKSGGPGLRRLVVDLTEKGDKGGGAVDLFSLSLPPTEPPVSPPALPPSPVETAPAVDAGQARILAEADRAINPGPGEKPDLARAFALYRKAADAGSPVAAFALGQMYRLGAGRAVNEPLAAFWYGEGARAGYPPAELNFGLMQMKGTGLNPDPEAGMEMIRRSAAHGNGLARRFLEEVDRVSAGETAGTPPKPAKRR